MAKSRKPAKDTPETVKEAVVVDEPKKAEPKTTVDKNAVKEKPTPPPEEGISDTLDSDKMTDTKPDAKKTKVGVADDKASDIKDTPDAKRDSAPDLSGPAEPRVDAGAGGNGPADPPAAQPASSEPKGGGSGFFGLLLGGAIAAAIGFGAARYPDQWPFATEPSVDPVEAKLTDFGDRLSGLEDTTASQSASLTALQDDAQLQEFRGELTGTLDDLRGQIDTMSAKMTDLDNRLHSVEKMPEGSGMEAAAAAAAAYERELKQMRQMLDTELERITAAKDEAQTLEVNAAETARAAAARAAMSRVLNALETGRPYDNALFDVTQNAGVDAPPALAEHASDGIVTLAQLQDSFPKAARVALDASIRASAKGDHMERFTAFLRTQLGARSLEPKEGDDPDAVLSRAEAALKNGQIDVALTELEAMPDAGQPALEVWITQATARKNALEAAQALAQQVNSN